jgi:magnesium chelatase accessory protein
MRRGFLALPLACLGGYALARTAIVARVRRFESVSADDIEPAGVTLSVRGRRIHVMIDGSGPPLLLLHGFGATAFDFRRVAPLLRDRFTLIAPDLPGFGGSERDPQADHSYEALAALFLELLSRLEVERFAVLGHSIGAAVALRMAAMAPDRVERLVLAGGPGRPASLPAPLAPLVTLLVPLLVESRRGVRWLTRSAMVRGAEPDPAVVDAYLSAARVRGHAATLVAMLTRTRHRPPPGPATIETPTLLLTGERDGYMPPRRARALASRMPRARAAIVPGAAHLLFEEQPEPCADRIRAFLERDSWAATDTVESPRGGIAPTDAAATVAARRPR